VRPNGLSERCLGATGALLGPCTVAVWLRTVFTLSGAGRSARGSLADLGTPPPFDCSDLSKASIFFSRLLFLAGLTVMVSRLARTVCMTGPSGSLNDRDPLSLLARGREGGGVGTDTGLSHRNSSTAMSSLRVEGMFRLLPLLDGRLSLAAGMIGFSKSLAKSPSPSTDVVVLLAMLADGAGEGGFRSALLGGIAGIMPGLGGDLTIFRAFGTDCVSFIPGIIIIGPSSRAKGDRLNGE
jgi:hypothetical protein